MFYRESLLSVFQFEAGEEGEEKKKEEEGGKREKKKVKMMHDMQNVKSENDAWHCVFLLHRI